MKHSLSKLKRFLAFAGASYYPEGGAHDFLGCFHHLSTAELAALKDVNNDWAHVMDLFTGEIVRAWVVGERDPNGPRKWERRL